MKLAFSVPHWLTAAALGAIVFASTASHAQIRERTIRVGIGLGEDHPQGQAVMKFAELVEKKSGGKMIVVLFDEGQLGNDKSMVTALLNGDQEMTVPDTSTLVDKIKEFGVLNFPFLFNNEREADALLDGRFGQKLIDKLAPHGLVGLAYWENGFRQATNSKRPIQTVDDFRGIKLRVMQNPLFIDTFKLLGANAVPMPFTELYTAMELKNVDGQENPTPTILNSKFYEVQKFVSLTKHSYSVWIVLFSKRIWDSYSPQEQRILREAAIESRAFERRLIRQASNDALAQLRAKGMQVNELSAAEVTRMRQTVQPVVQKFAKDFGEDAYAEVQAELARIRAGR